MMPKSQLRLHVQVSAQAPTEGYCVAGSTRVLGEWNPLDGVPLEWKGGTWATRQPIQLPPRERVEFKFVRRRANGLEWEDGPNRVLEVPAGDADLKLRGRFNADIVLSMANGADIDESKKAAAAEAGAIAAYQRTLEETDGEIAAVEQELRAKREQYLKEREHRVACVERVRAELANVRREIADHRAAKAKEEEVIAAAARAAIVAERAAAAKAASEQRGSERATEVAQQRVARQLEEAEVEARQVAERAIAERRAQEMLAAKAKEEAEAEKRAAAAKVAAEQKAREQAAEERAAAAAAPPKATETPKADGAQARPAVDKREVAAKAAEAALRRAAQAAAEAAGCEGAVATQTAPEQRDAEQGSFSEAGAMAQFSTTATAARSEGATAVRCPSASRVPAPRLKTGCTPPEAGAMTPTTTDSAPRDTPQSPGGAPSFGPPAAENAQVDGTRQGFTMHGFHHSAAASSTGSRCSGKSSPVTPVSSWKPVDSEHTAPQQEQPQQRKEGHSQMVGEATFKSPLHVGRASNAPLGESIAQSMQRAVEGRSLSDSALSSMVHYVAEAFGGTTLPGQSLTQESRHRRVEPLSSGDASAPLSARSDLSAATTPGVTRSGSAHTMNGDWAVFSASPGARGYERATGGRLNGGRGRVGAILQRRTPKSGRHAPGPLTQRQLPEVPEAAQAEHAEGDVVGVPGARVQAAADTKSWKDVQASSEDVTGLGRFGGSSTAAFGSGFLVSSPEVRAAFEVAKVRFAARQAEAASRVRDMESGGFR